MRVWRRTGIRGQKEHKPGHANNTVCNTGGNCELFVLLKKPKLQLCRNELKELLFIQEILYMELLIVRLLFLCSPPCHTSSECCSVPAVLKMCSEDHNSTGVFLFFAFICRFVSVGRKSDLFTAITGVVLNPSSISAFDVAYCLLQSCLPHHPEPFTLLQLLSINKSQGQVQGVPEMWSQ